MPWDATKAYTLRDANRQNVDILDHWLAMNRATNMTEFKQAFQDYDGVVFNNTMAADKEGNAFTSTIRPFRICRPQGSIC